MNDRYDPSGKSAAEIEADIAETRERLGGTLNALEREIAPKRLIEKGMDMVWTRTGGHDVAETARDALRDHPISLALIGAGLGWFLLRRTGPAQAGLQMAADAGGGLYDKASSKVGGARDTMMAYARTKTPGGGFGRGTEPSGGIGRTMRDHPLVVGGLVLLAGALVAAALPTSDTEHRTFGDLRDDVVDRVKTAGQDAAETAERIARDTVASASETARTGLRDASDTMAPRESDVRAARL